MPKKSVTMRRPASYIVFFYQKPIRNRKAECSGPAALEALVKCDFDLVDATLFAVRRKSGLSVKGDADDDDEAKRFLKTPKGLALKVVLTLLLFIFMWEILQIAIAWHGYWSFSFSGWGGEPPLEDLSESELTRKLEKAYRCPPGAECSTNFGQLEEGL